MRTWNTFTSVTAQLTQKQRCRKHTHCIFFSLQWCRDACLLLPSFPWWFEPKLYFYSCNFKDLFRFFPLFLLQKLNLMWAKQSSVLNVNAFPSTSRYRANTPVTHSLRNLPKILPCNPINNNNNHSINSYFCKLAPIYFFWLLHLK